MHSSYLQKKSQKVDIKYNDTLYIKSQNIPYGVPQGSVLASALFLLYINDLHQYLIEDTVLITTCDDNTNLLIYDKSFEDLKVKAKRLYKKLENGS